jgi:hypothetical protein
VYSYRHDPMPMCALGIFQHCDVNTGLRMMRCTALWLCVRLKGTYITPYHLHTCPTASAVEYWTHLLVHLIKRLPACFGPLDGPYCSPHVFYRVPRTTLASCSVSERPLPHTGAH